MSQSQNFIKPPQAQTQPVTAQQTLSVSADYSEVGKVSVRPCSTQSKSIVIMNKEMQLVKYSVGNVEGHSYPNCLRTIGVKSVFGEPK